MMGWFERQKNKEEADKEAGARLPERASQRAEGETGDFEQGESKFRFLLENMRSGVAIYQATNNGEDFIIIDFNRAAEKLENVRREDVIGKNVVEAFPSIKEMGLLEVLRRVWKTGKAEFSQATLYRDPIRTGWRENYVYKLPSGEIAAIYDDVTERKRSELALRMGEQRFRAIADYTYHWESWVGPTGTLFWVNPAVERITGYTVEECMKMSDYPMPLIHEADRETMTDILREARKGGVGKDVEFRIRRKDGKIIWVEIAWQGIYDNKGVYQGYRASIDDITERALAQEALKASEERYRALVENVELGIVMADIDHTIITANSGISKLFGKSISEVIGKKCDELFVGEDAKIFGSCPGDLALQKCERVVVEKEGIRADGSRFAARVQAFPVYPAGELSAYFIEVVEDITEDKLSQEKLRESDIRYSSFVQNFKGIAFRAKPDFTPIFVHGMVQDITGYTDEEFISGKVRWEQIVHPDDMRLAYDGETKKLQMVPGFSNNKEYRIIRKDGAVRWVHHRAQNQAGEDGKVAYIQGTIHDITDRRAAEDALRERMKEITCLYAVSRDIQEDLPIDKLCRRAVEHLVSAMQFPEITVPVIEVSGKRFTSKNYTKGLSYGLHAEIRMKDEALGRLSVYYTEERPFLIPEEQNLVNGVAEAISMWLERKQAEEDLANLTSLLSSTIESTFSGILVVDRKGKITSFNQKFAAMWRIPDSVLATHDDKQALEFAVSQLSDPKGFLRKVQELYSNPERESFDIINFKDGRIFERYSRPQKIDDEIVGRVWTFHDITERKRAEEELLKGEKKYRELVETMSEGLGMSDKDDVLTYANRRFAEMLGYRQDEMIGHHVTDFMDEQNRQIMHVQTAQRRAGKVGPYDLTWTAKDGHKIYTLISPKGIFDEKGNFQGSYGVLMDISERKKAEEELRASKEQFRALTETTSDWVWEVNQDGVYTYASPKVRDLLGYEPQEVIGRTPFEFMPPDEAQRVSAVFAQIMKLQKPFVAIENVNLRKDGRRVVLETSGVPFFGADGKLAGYRGIDRDITERKKAERALRETEQTIRAIIETSQEWIWAVDMEGFHTYSNPAIERILGYKPEELIGRRSFDLMHEEDRKQITEKFPLWIKQKSGWSGRIIRWRHKDGSYRYLESNAVAILDSQGNLAGFRGVDRDITKRKRAEEKLRREEQKYHEIVDSIAEGIGISDENYLWTYVNKRFAEMLGYGQDEMIGRKVTDFMDEQNRKMMAGQIAKRKRGVSEPYDVTWVAKDGYKVYTMVSPKGIYDEEGNFRASFGVMVDITERRKAEEERESLFKAIEQKNKELESILYVASHDLKSALLSIESLGNDLKESCELVKLVLADKFEQLDEKSRDVLDRDIPETVKSILSSAGKMEILLGGLLRLSHAGSAALNVERLDMNKILAEIVESFEQQIAEEKISVEIEELPWCMGDVSLIKEVFSNLLDNALKYLDDSRRGVVRVWGKVEDGQSVYCVEDNGIGIAHEHYEKIFDMFYQLEHGKKRGEGLGLTIVRRILDRHKGRVWVASEVGKGSRFYVSLSRER